LDGWKILSSSFTTTISFLDFAENRLARHAYSRGMACGGIFQWINS
jgi:hypothetical protein